MLSLKLETEGGGQKRKGRRRKTREAKNAKKIVINFLVTMIVRKHLFPYRTQKLSSQMLKILVSYLAGKISSCQIFYIKDIPQ